MAIHPMQKLVSDYLARVDETLATLEELAEESEQYSRVIKDNEQHRRVIEDSRREIANLQSQRQELYQDFHTASFEADHLRIVEIEGQRDSIDQRIAELQEQLEDHRGRIEELDGVAVAEMLDRTYDAKAPIFSNRFLQFEKNPNPTGLVDLFEREHKAVVQEISDKKRYILDMQNWARYANEINVALR